MAILKSRQELPDIDKPIADIIEKLGFGWTYDTEHPLPDTKKRMQVREEKHYTPTDMVAILRDVLKRGEKYAAVVVAKDAYIVDGNTKTEAARRNGMPFIHAFILDRPWQGPPGEAQERAQQRMLVLGMRLNQHGKRGTRGELRKAIERIGPDKGWDAKRLAEQVGAKATYVQSVFAQMKARERLAKLNLEPNGSLTESQMRIFGTCGLNDAPLRELVWLTADTGLSPQELRDLVKRAKAQHDDDEAVRIIQEEREARAEQIATYVATGKSKPPVAAQLRQRLGFILERAEDPLVLCELNPSEVTKHVAMVRHAIAVLEKVVAQHATQEA